MRIKHVLIIGVLVISGSLFFAYHVKASATAAIQSQSSPNDLIAEVNALRTSNGLSPYSVSSILMSTAQAQANYMASTGSITHSGPGGVQLTQRLLNAGYPLAGDLSLGGFRAENITGGPNKSAAQAIQEWTGDAPHLNTMLSPNLMEIGAGVAKVGSMVYLVVDCARPTSSGEQQAYTPDPNSANDDASPYSPSDFIVPIVTSTPDKDGRVYHEVQYGQTLWGIAIEYGVKIDEIRALNNLGTGTDIFQGDKLLIKKNGPTLQVSGTAPGSSEEDTTPTSKPAAIGPPSTTPGAVTGVSEPNPTGTKVVPNSETPDQNSPDDDAPVAGIALGIALVALLLAGMVTRMSSLKPSE